MQEPIEILVNGETRKTSIQELRILHKLQLVNKYIKLTLINKVK